ncbi:hypothetical protein TanjilG_05304 [Lupinus angustifolius]|uniref:Sm domain-containing protein n=1 Tax=Lupinus angustifolius TaxID=3871 RepID=A0A4P1QW69_LUPAN|nr:PREDICTED: uncharacterized protein LOC109329921 [Lupinus angustifolius]XP_019419363.1 PREDICTED: uncharacterized protein LOC109329921 [Lupinus angustifolius]OIV95756.1 hypothetical protein TanjilG_05304 [Lupinus angustifolius]
MEQETEQPVPVTVGCSDGSCLTSSSISAGDSAVSSCPSGSTILTGDCSADRSFPANLSPVSRVRKLLFRRMLVGIKDGRFFMGGFYCMDKQGNIILQDTVEYRSTRRSSPSPMEQRCLGLILIPASCRTSCHVDCSVEEQLSLLSLQGK